MYCEKCGTENANGTKFCKGCGAPLSGVSLNGAQQTEKPAGGIQKPEFPKMPKMNKPVPKKAIAGTAAAVVVIAAAVSMTVNSGKTIQLNKYLTVEADGYDGYGTAQTFVDWDAIEKKYGSKLEFTKEARMEYGSMLKMMDPMDFLEGSVAIDVDQNYDLSNGDTISYTWIINDDVAKYLNCKVNGLSYYLSKTSEISEEAWTQMKQQASDVYQAKAAKKWGTEKNCRTCLIWADIFSQAKMGIPRTMYANSEDFQVLAITTMVSSFVAEWNDQTMKIQSGVKWGIHLPNKSNITEASGNRQ